MNRLSKKDVKLGQKNGNVSFEVFEGL